jgi:hypothetical protein
MCHSYNVGARNGLAKVSCYICLRGLEVVLRRVILGLALPDTFISQPFVRLKVRWVALMTTLGSAVNWSISCSADEAQHPSSRLEPYHPRVFTLSAKRYKKQLFLLSRKRPALREDVSRSFSLRRTKKEGGEAQLAGASASALGRMLRKGANFVRIYAA